MTQRSPSPFSQRSSLPVPPPISAQMPSHPLLQQQFAKFVEDRTAGTAEHYTEISSVLVGGAGAAGVDLSPESSEVIAREIARLQASRAADAERLKLLMQRKGG